MDYTMCVIEKTDNAVILIEQLTINNNFIKVFDSARLQIDTILNPVKTSGEVKHYLTSIYCYSAYR